MKIPTSFTLGGTEWKVTQPEYLVGNMGGCSNQEAAIVVLKSLKPHVKEQTFLHELVHAILFSMGKNGDHDEQFVDCFATFLHQALTSMKKGIISPLKEGRRP